MLRDGVQEPNMFVPTSTLTGLQQEGWKALGDLNNARRTIRFSSFARKRHCSKLRHAAPLPEVSMAQAESWALPVPEVPPFGRQVGRRVCQGKEETAENGSCRRFVNYGHIC